MWLENILAYAHLWRGSTQIEYSSQKMDKYENGEYRLKDKFCFNDLLTKSNLTEIQTYKAGERTFGTPRKRHRKFIPKRFFKIPFEWDI